MNQARRHAPSEIQIYNQYKRFTNSTAMVKYWIK